jgi:hypothetical protein
MAQKRRELDWFTIKYKDIYTVIIAIVLIVMAGTGGFIYWRWAGNPEGKAERTLVKARKLIEEVDKPDIRPEARNTVTQARSTYALAEGEFKQRRFKQAFEMATDLVDTLSDLKKRSTDITKFALLQELEGQVEVKKSGQHLFSSGKENLPLESGDIVKTGKDGSCRIKYHTGLINVVNPDTLMVIQISMNPTGGSRIQTTVNEGTVEMQTPGNLKENEQSVLAGKNTKVTTPADSRTAITQDKASGKTRTALMEGSGTVEGPRGQTQILTQGTAVEASESEIGDVQTLSGPPSPTSPKDGEILRSLDPSRTPVTLEWAGGAAGTMVQVSGKALFTKLLGEQTVKGNKLSLEGLPAGTYYWRLKAPGEAAKTFWCKTQKFRVMKILPPPQIRRELKLKVESTPIGDGVILQGSTDPGVSVSINNLEIPVNADGSFNKIVLFGEVGSPQIMVRAFDDQGNEKIIPLKFQRSSD